MQKQQREANEDWLKQSEQQMKPLEQQQQQQNLAQGVSGLKVGDDLRPASAMGAGGQAYSSADDVTSVASSSSSSAAVTSSASSSGPALPAPPSVAPAKPPRNPTRGGNSSVPAAPKVEFEEVRPTPTMQIDRSEDAVYRDTMMVVKAVLQANQAILRASSNEILDHVKVIGNSLKKLVTSVTSELTRIDECHHREIDMAQKTTNKDLSQIIAQMRLVNRFIATSQVADYKKCLMAATQVLAMDVKNLLDVVDSARMKSSSASSSRLATASSSSQDIASSVGSSSVADDPMMPLPPPPTQFLDG